MKKMFFSFISLFLIVGCSINPVKKETVAAPEPVIISKTEYVFVSIPDNLLTTCKIEQPPPVKDYLEADWPNKEAILSVYIKSLLGNIAACNSKFFNLKKWNQSQKDIYSPDIKEK